MEWMPIETAPLDETVLLYPHMVTAAYDFGADNWLIMNVPLNLDMTIAGEFEMGNPWFEVLATTFGAPTPTHWMRLPAPPSDQAAR